MFGYAGKILYLDLTRKKAQEKPVSLGFCKEYIGGNGFSIRLLYENTELGTDPFSPDNVLIFATGPFVGTMFPTSNKHVVQAKSPLTGFMGEAVSSGFWASTLKQAGYDVVVVRGRSDSPVHVFIDDGDIRFLNAANLWGRNIPDTDEVIKEEIGDENVHSAIIGPAGENLVRFSIITSDNRQAARTGLGAVMGAKKMKALSVRGTKSIQVFDLDKLMVACNELYTECQGPGYEELRMYGTPPPLLRHHLLGVLPTRNWQQSSFDLVDKISAEYIKKQYGVKMVACSPSCPIACDGIYTVRDGPFKGTTSSVEFESIFALGAECGVGYFPGIVQANDLCDKLGLDTISTGVTIGWAMECFEKRLFTKEDVDGLELRFGNAEAVVTLIPKIASRQGIGNLLAEGVKRAAHKVRRGSEKFAMHGKGLELEAFDLRGLKACALGFMVSTRGACHVRGFPFYFDRNGLVDRFRATRELGRIVKDSEELWTMFDCLVICKFLFGPSDYITKDKTSAAVNYAFYSRLAEFYRLVTGIELSGSELKQAAERVWNLEKSYNIREGWTIKDEYPPPRIMKEPISAGPSKGSVVTKKEFKLMLDAYFKVRDWTPGGIPTKKKLADLGLEFVSERLPVKKEAHKRVA